MGSGIMGSLMQGMAFGAASEMIRGLFRNPSTGPYMMPLILGGGSAFLTNYLMKSHPQRRIFALAAFGTVFLIAKSQ